MNRDSYFNTRKFTHTIGSQLIPMMRNREDIFNGNKNRANKDEKLVGSMNNRVPSGIHNYFNGYNSKFAKPLSTISMQIPVTNNLNDEKLDISRSLNLFLFEKTVSSGVTIQGYKPGISTKNQDSSLIMECSKRASAYAVFDGHGVYGDKISDFVRSQFRAELWKLLLPYCFNNNAETVRAPSQMDMTYFMGQLYNKISSNLGSLNGDVSLWSGCTSVVAVRFDNDIFISWLGDSKFAAYRFTPIIPNIVDGHINWNSINSSNCRVDYWVTSDHAPNRPDECQRINSFGGSVVVYPTPWLTKPTVRIREHGIAMSRSFGDRAGERFGVISVPEIATLKMTNLPENTGSLSKWIFVVASDGVWDSFTEEEIGAKLLHQLYLPYITCEGKTPDSSDIKRIAKSIAQEAWTSRVNNEKYSDDTTCIITFFD